MLKNLVSGAKRGFSNVIDGIPENGSSSGVVDPRLIWPKVMVCSLPEVEMVVGSVSKTL
ncbi:unnamed protein product, partial [Vitis vinifera]